MKIYGHRGAAGLVAENTLESFYKALEFHADGIEFDVRCCADGDLVVIHDETVERTTNGHGKVADLPIAVLRELGVPTVQRVLDEMSGRVRLNIELKERQASKPMATLIQSLIPAKRNEILVTSFDMTAIRVFRELDSITPVGLLTDVFPQDEYWENSVALSASTANVSVKVVDLEFVRRAHALGLQVMVYTVNTLDAANTLRRLGVDAIFTDYPNLFATAR